jgi:hypothetical protein
MLGYAHEQGCVARERVGASRCGARTGLRVSDVPDPIDAEASDVVDVPREAILRDVPRFPEVCAPRTEVLSAGRTELIFVLDRSGSMGWGLMGRDSPGPTRWELLSRSLRTTRPRYDRQIDMGLLLYPRCAAMDDSCSVSTVLDVYPSVGNARPIPRLFDAASPGGLHPNGACATHGATAAFACGRPRACTRRGARDRRRAELQWRAPWRHLYVHKWSGTRYHMNASKIARDFLLRVTL